MSEHVTEPEQPTGTEGQEPPEKQEPEKPEVFDRDYVEKLRRENAEARTKLRKAEEQAEEQRKASMSDAARAVAEAEARGRTSATQALGQRLARSEYLAAAALRNPQYDTSSVLDDINLARFVGDDGEPDVDAIKASVSRLVPEGTTRPATPRPDPGQGPRPAAPDADAAEYEQFYPTTTR